jgi:hypothetical protein
MPFDTLMTLPFKECTHLLLPAKPPMQLEYRLWFWFPSLSLLVFAVHALVYCYSNGSVISSTLK